MRGKWPLLDYCLILLNIFDTLVIMQDVQSKSALSLFQNSLVSAVGKIHLKYCQLKLLTETGNRMYSYFYQTLS